MLALQQKIDQNILALQAKGARWPDVFERCFVAFLVSYGVLLTWFCGVKVLAFDELLSFYTASASSVGRLIASQRTAPVSLDPPLVHLFAHAALKLGVAPVFAVRLPSLFGACLMVACVYIFTRRLAGRWVASFAIVGLLIADTFHFVEARPYGVMLGLAAIALVLWQNAACRYHRTFSLAALFLTLVVAINSHYFAVLLVFPLLIAEVVRSISRRRLDAGITGVLLASVVSALGWLPFLAGAHQYKSNYYIKVQWTDVARAYTMPFQKAFGVKTHTGEWILFICVFLLLAMSAWLGYRRSGKGESETPAMNAMVEWTAVFSFAVLPFFGVLLARIASGAFETRYVIEFTLGTSICLAAGLVASIRGRTARAMLLVAGCIVSVCFLAREVRRDSADRRALEQIAQQTLAERTVITDKEQFLWLHAYHGAEVGPAQTLWVADLDREIAATGSDNIDRTMINLKTMAGLPVIPYKEFVNTSQPFQIIVDDATNPPNWLPAGLTLAGMRMTSVASSQTGHVYQVDSKADSGSVPLVK